MRLAFVSDIHGNLAALTAVLQDLERQGVDEVLIGGDLVEGGRQPADVLDLLMARAWPAVRGNADVNVLDLLEGRRTESELATTTVAWTAARLAPRHLDYMRALPLTVRRPLLGERLLLLVHATPWSIEDVVPPDAPEETARRMVRTAHADIVVYGHIHSAYHRRLPEGLLVSAGGVSGSNDRDPCPAYTILTVGPQVTVEVRRVTYDVEAELAAIEQAGLPLRQELRDWLRAGGPWPVRA